MSSFDDVESLIMSYIAPTWPAPAEHMAEMATKTPVIIYMMTLTSHAHAYREVAPAVRRQPRPHSTPAIAFAHSSYSNELESRA